MRCYAGFPPLAGDQLLGTVAFASTTRDRFAAGDLQATRTVCDQVVMTLERRRLFEELRTREIALKDADRRKDDFIATLAHELRNPLAPIRHAASVLRHSRSIDPQLRWCRDVIERQVMQMARLLEDLLDVSRVTHDKIELCRKPIELVQAIEQAIEATQPLIDAQGHRLTVNLPPDPVRLDGDLAR